MTKKARKHKTDRGRLVKVTVIDYQATAMAIQLDLISSQMIEDAIDRNELTLVFQPQNCLGTDSLFGIEVLTRWNSLELGTIDTQHFIEILESSSLLLVKKFHEWLLKETFTQMSLWQDLGLSVPVFINFSSRYLQCKDSLSYILYLIQEYRIDPHFLGIELTETAPITYKDEIFFVLHHLNMLGIKISLDDFCTSYCSLEYLCDLPVDMIKLDKRFVHGLVDDSRERRVAMTTIVEHLIAMAHQLGIKVVAEGVETIEQLELVTAMGCDAFQGYLLSRPVVAPILRLMLSNLATHKMSYYSACAA